MFVNKIPFFITISCHIKFGTVELIPNQKVTTLVKAMQGINTVYEKRGFCIQHLFMDGQFEPMRSDILDMKINLNIVSANKHVPEIERYIRTTKERTQCVYNTLPFTKMPGGLVAEMVVFSNFWLNSFPHPDGISDPISPRTIMTGIKLDFAKHCKLKFGSYVQTHEEHNNSMATRTISTIDLCPTGNVQGGYYFYSLTTGRCLNCNHWTALPVPIDAIDRIHKLTRRNGATNGITFADRHHNIIADDDDNSNNDSYNPAADDLSDDDDSIHSDDESHNSDGDNQPPADDPFQQDNGNTIPTVPIVGVDNHENNEIEPDKTHPADNIAETDPTENLVAPENLPNTEEDDLVATEPVANLEDELELQHSSRPGMQPRRPRKYAGRYKNTNSIRKSGVALAIEHYGTKQYGIKKGIKIFGDKGTNAVLSELKQVLYVELKKALYGTLRAALLFWRKLSKHLVDNGYVINPYNWCVTNKIINNKQCTIVWHVDDLKIS